EPRGRGGAVDRGVLADDRPLADLDPGLLAAVLEVLRRAAQDAADAHLHRLREAHVALERHARADATAARDADIGADDRERADLDVVGDLRRRVDQHGGMDVLAHRSTTCAIISASQTRWPSTNATPRILQVRPRNWSIS